MTPAYMSVQVEVFCLNTSTRLGQKSPRSWRHESRHLRKARGTAKKRVAGGSCVPGGSF